MKSNLGAKELDVLKYRNHWTLERKILVNFKRRVFIQLRSSPEFFRRLGSIVKGGTETDLKILDFERKLESPSICAEWDQRRSSRVFVKETTNKPRSSKPCPTSLQASVKHLIASVLMALSWLASSRKKHPVFFQGASTSALGFSRVAAGWKYRAIFDYFVLDVMQSGLTRRGKINTKYP